MRNNKVKIVAVVGPTGSGKTRLAVALAKKFNGVIISADSRQVYRGLDVGTNKEGEPEEYLDQPVRVIDGVAQLGVDVVNPGERFTLHDWLKGARELVELVLGEGKLPIIVGGTGLYVTALLDGYEPGEGRFSKKRRPTEYQALVIMPAVDREVLYRRSDDRCRRIEADLVAETNKLISEGAPRGWLSNIGLDYRYASSVIAGRPNRQLLIEQLQQASRAYIRRQLTWWRHHGQVIETKTEQEAKKVVEAFLKVEPK